MQKAIPLLLLAVTGCGSIVQIDNVTKFGEGVAQTQQQAQLAFHDANALAREEAIQYILATTRPGLSEKDFTPALSPEAVAAWDKAFIALQSYASSLERLLSKDQATQLGEEATKLGAELKDGKMGARISPGVEAAFTQLGEVIITLQAEHNAQIAMKKANKSIQLVLQSMAEAIGGTNNDGVRAIVWVNWEAKIGEGPIHAYSEAVKDHNNMDKKRAAIDSFENMLDERDAQLASLASLHQSLLFLANAHMAAANGSSASVTEFITIIGQQLNETKSLVQQFKEADNGKHNKSGPEKH